MVNEGKDIYFDCAPIDYTNRTQQPNAYYKDLETKNGKQVISET